jgi:hypothetical protein
VIGISAWCRARRGAAGQRHRDAILSPGRWIHPGASRHDTTVESIFPIGG